MYVQVHTTMPWHAEARTGCQVSFSIHLHFVALNQGLSLNLSFGQVGWQASELCVFSVLYLTYRYVQPWPDVNEGARNLNSGPWAVSSALKNFILEILQGWSSVDRFLQFLFI